ncbi:phage tail tip lysozyme [Enterococcus sp. DIV0800]|uniref:phage tail tip lysozyme n=1 Tax=unclassified Enterococcus TaxID=2608891 RepID=UPI003D2FF92D
MATIETALSWFQQRQGKVTYSMGARTGPTSYDCSSAVYYALIAAGYMQPRYPGNTESLFGDLEKLGWKQVAQNQATRGDIFIWGVRGASSGAAGHTGMFVNGKDIIHCNGGSNGISTTNYAQSLQWAGNPPQAIYHDPKSTAGSAEKRVTFTEEEKVVIIMFKELSLLGYSIEAIAAMAGNSDAESGNKPDTSELGGGPGYGLWQWTSPHAGETGKSYVTRLMKQAGIPGSIADAANQTKLAAWGMTNGQWIGVVDPKAVEGFKKGTDVKQLTIAFLKNFERAGVERLDVRISSAQKWYEFLKKYKENPDSPELMNLPGYEVSKKTLQNAGELNEFGIKDGKIFAKGWHFSSGKPFETIQVIDAENEKVLQTFEIDLITRPDVKEANPDVDGVELSGFEISFKVADGKAVYLRGIRSDGNNKDELIFDGFLIFEPAEDAEIDEYAIGNEDFWFEIIENQKIKFRGKKLLNDLSWSNGLMFTPTLLIELPIDYLKYFTGREEMKIFVNNKVFHGIVDQKEEDTVEGILRIELIHVIDEWRYRQLSTNLACKNRTINDIFSTYDFRYSKRWHVDFLQDSAKRVIDYVFSRQTKLDALTKVCNLTDDVFWRVGFFFGRLLEIGTFGDKKPYTLSTKPSSKQNIRIISEPVFTHELAEVVNMATVYGEKSDSGMSSMSLRDIYFDAKSQKKGFPVRILRNAINNERGYDYVNVTKLAPNNAIEYTVIDEQSIAVESNTAIEGSFSFNDLSPFSTNGETISDEDRAKAAKTAYDAAVKRLIQMRRGFFFEVTTEEIPADLQVGDRIRFMYDLSQFNLEECNETIQRILTEDDWFYITNIDYNIAQEDRSEINVLRLQKDLRIDREVG